MCRDGNSASLSARYLNGQLQNLWENAVECIKECEHTVTWASEDYERSSYTRALAQFQFFGKRPARTINSTDDLLFHATFGKPELKFVCNHEAVLYLTVENAAFNLEYGKATAADYQLDPTQTVRVGGLQLAYRLAFSRSSLRGRDTNTSTKHLIQLLVLELSSAKLVLLRPETGLAGAAKTALLFYMHKYLEFLQSAGHHTLYDLPDFEGKFKAKIDYALQERPADLEVLSAGVSIQGTNLQEVNAFLNRQWLTAASSEQPEDPLSKCLAELSSSWLSHAETDTRFHVRFGPPKITALCQDELILCLDIEDVAFFKDLGADAETVPTVYHNWKIAFVVNVVQETEGGQAVLRLDFESARFSSYDSFYAKSDESAVAFFQQLVKFITTDYWSLLVHYRIDLVYSVEVDFTASTNDRDSIRSVASDSSWSLSSPTTPKEPRASTDMAAWAAREDDMASVGFDQVLTISEHSVNVALAARWKGASEGQADECLLRWSCGAFQASFGAIRMRLLSHGKVIIWLNIDECEVEVASETVRTDFWTWVGFKAPTKEQTTETHQFNDLAIAFEVDLKLLEDTVLTLNDAWHKAFESTAVFANTLPGNRVFRHLLLNITDAKYVSELSSAHSLGQGRAALTRLQTIVYHVKEYLAVLAAGGHHIIHSIPIFKKGSSVPAGLTDVSCQVVSRTEVTVQSCLRKHSAPDAPVILLVGVCSFRPLPALALDWASGLVFSRKSARTMGTACLSRGAFLEGRVLRVLARVNAATTIVPVFAGVIDGDWHCDLTTWEQHDYRRGKECRWKRVSGSVEGYAEYEWQHRDDWNHEHEGTDGERAGEYHLSCHTRNVVRVPTALRPNGLEFELRGESTIKVSGKTDHQWSMRSVASWSTSIIVFSEVSGLIVEQAGELRPVFAEVESEGQSVLDIHALHAAHLSRAINLESMLQELKGLWEGAWEFSSLGCQNFALANPVFNQHGDLLVQLGMYGARQTVYGTPRRQKSGIPPRLSLRQMTSASPLIRGLDVPLPPSTASSGPSTPVPRTSPLPSVHSTPSSSRLRSAQDYGTRQMTITLASQEQVVTKEEFRTTEQYVYQSESGF